MSYIRYGVPTTEPGLNTVSRVVSAIPEPTGPQTHSGSVSFDLTLTFDTSGTLRQRARVIRGRDAHKEPDKEQTSRIYRRLIARQFGVVDLPLTLTFDTAGTATVQVKAKVYKALEPHSYPDAQAGSRIIPGVTRTTQSSADLDLTVGFATEGTAFTPQPSRKVHRAREPFQYDLAEPVSRVFQALAAKVSGAASLDLTFNIATEGTASGPQPVRIGVARAGQQNVGQQVRAPEPQALDTVPLESRGFVYYHAAPPIYRVIVPGSTNQSFSAYPVVQPAAPEVPPSRRIKGYSSAGPTTHFGAASLDLTITFDTTGTARGIPRVVRGRDAHREPDKEQTSRIYRRQIARHSGSASLDLTITFDTAGANRRPPNRAIVQGGTNRGPVFAPTPQNDPVAPLGSRTFKGKQVFAAAVDLPLTVNFDTSGVSRRPPNRAIVAGGTNRGPLFAPIAHSADNTRELKTRVYKPRGTQGGSVSADFTVTFTTAGFAVKRSSVTLPLSFGVDTAARILARGSVTLPIVVTFGSAGDILGAGLISHFDPPSPGGRSRISTGAGRFDKPRPGRG